jgi:hypothetical protein
MFDIDSMMSGPGSFEIRFDLQELRWAEENEQYFRARQQAERAAACVFCRHLGRACASHGGAA